MKTNYYSSTYASSRSLKDLYPEKYQEYLSSDFYKYKNSIQTEIKELSLICKERANYKCELCGDHAIDAHHIIPLEEDGPNTLDNLICVCRSCHRQIHKGVYEFDVNLKKFKPVINFDHIISEKEKPKYIQAFEDMIGTTLYKNTGGYYAFINNIKVKYDVKAIKSAVGYTDECSQVKIKETERLNAKKQSIKDRKLLKYLASEYKAQGDKYRWHQFARLSRDWDTYEDAVKEQIMNSILKYGD